MQNFYKVLGIASTADDTRIKSAFRRRAKALHPDLNPCKRAEQRFKELTRAYEVLRNARARASYDAFLVDTRRERRRRFTRAAGLMAASFMLTMVSAYAVLALHDADVPFWEVWQTAKAPPHATVAATSARTASLADTSRDVVKSPATPSAARKDGPSVVASVLPPAATPPVPAPRGKSEAVSKLVKAKQEPQRHETTNGSERAERARTASAQRRKRVEPETPAKAQKKLAAATEALRPANSERKEAGWLWPTADEPFMALGATAR